MAACLLLLVFGLSLLPPVAAEPLRLFVPGSLEEIRSRHAGPFLLALWSLDCPPCRKELKLLGETLKVQPELDLVLIATDDKNRAGEAEVLLTHYGLDKVESWIFASANVQRLRYDIDPGWYGELPRTFFYLPDGQRMGVSGPLRPEQIDAWLKTLSK